MRKIFTLSVCLSAMVGVFSCSKVEVLLTPDPIDVLTGGNAKGWVFVNSKTNGKSDMEACDNDNVVTYTKATSKALTEVGAKKCDPDDTNATSTFKLSNDGKTLTLDTFTFTVVKLTDTELELKTDLFGDTGEFFFRAK